jgi:DNA-binding transcriptional ArsR family regulator
LHNDANEKTLDLGEDEVNQRPEEACCQGLEELMDPKLFKALSGPNRIALLSRLAQSPSARTVSEVADCCQVSFSVVSRHLATLREAGVLESRKQGKEVYHTVRLPELVSALRNLADAIEACCPPENEEKVSHACP